MFLAVCVMSADGMIMVHNISSRVESVTVDWTWSCAEALHQQRLKFN